MLLSTYRTTPFDLRMPKTLKECLTFDIFVGREAFELVSEKSIGFEKFGLEKSLGFGVGKLSLGKDKI